MGSEQCERSEWQEGRREGRGIGEGRGQTHQSVSGAPMSIRAGAAPRKITSVRNCVCARLQTNLLVCAGSLGARIRRTSPIARGFPGCTPVSHAIGPWTAAVTQG